MTAAVKWGVILALAVTVFNGIWVMAGLHTSPVSAAGYLAVVILLNIVAVILALKETAAENPYGKQLFASVVLGLVGGVVIFLTSWTMLRFVFAEAIPEQIAGFTEAYQGMPIPEEQKVQLIAALDGVTAFGSAFQGAIGTMLTSLLVGAITAAFLRKR